MILFTSMANMLLKFFLYNTCIGEKHACITS
nr:MAG TPA: hypothetical protein [Caudoviricetes sp.]